MADTPEPGKAKKTFFNFDTLAEEMTLTLSVKGRGMGQMLEGEIQRMFIAGMDQNEILNRLTEDLVSGGRIFGSFRRNLSETIGKNYDDLSQGEIFEEDPAAAVWEWIVTSSNPCPDCLPRHHEKATYEEWKSIGLPRSGFSVCKERCKCVLLPEEKVTSDLDNPVIVPSLTDLRTDFANRRLRDPALQAEIQKYRDEQREKRKKPSIPPGDLALRKTLDYGKQIDALSKEYAEGIAQRKEEIHYGFTQSLHKEMTDLLEAEQERFLGLPPDSPEIADSNRKRNELYESIESLEKKINAFHEYDERLFQEMQNKKQAVQAQIHRDVLYSDQGAARMTPKYSSSVFSKERKAKVELGVEWVEKVAGRNVFPEGTTVPVNATRRQRAFAGTQTINLPKQANTTTVVHELGHYIEEVNSQVGDAAKEYLKARTNNLKKVEVIPGYEEDEKYAIDDWTDPYMGKVYASPGKIAGQAYGEIDYTEIMSMGLQQMYADPIFFARKDPRSFSFIINTLRGAGK